MPERLFTAARDNGAIYQRHTKCGALEVGLSPLISCFGVQLEAVTPCTVLGPSEMSS